MKQSYRPEKLKPITLSDFIKNYLKQKALEIDCLKTFANTFNNNQRILSQLKKVIGDIPFPLVNKTIIEELKDNFITYMKNPPQDDLGMMKS